MAKACIRYPSLVYTGVTPASTLFQLPCRTLARPASTSESGFRRVLGRALTTVSRARTTLCCVLATWVVIASCAGASAQDLAPPGPDAAYGAYRTIDAWVRAAQAPTEAPADVPEVQAACVTVRLDGNIVGRGVSAGAQPSRAPVRDAAAEAIRHLPKAMSLVDRERLIVSVELSGALIPFHADTAAELTLGVSPGLEGVAVAKGDKYAAVFPSAMLTRGVGAAVGVVSLVTELGEDAQDALATPAQLRERGYRIYRFRTVQLAQTAPGGGAIFLHRGGRVAESPRTADLRAMADAMAGYLLGARWPGIEGYGLLGTLHPSKGRYDPPFAGAPEQAVVSLALLRYAEHRPDAPQAPAARAQALRLLEDLARVEDDERAPWADAPSAAACVIALAELGPDEVNKSKALPALLAKCRSALEGAYDADTGYAEGLPQPAWGLIADALVVDRARLGSKRLSWDAIEGAVRVVYRGTDHRFLVGQMPWLGWAELELADARAEPVAAAPALREVRRLVWDHQLRATDLDYQDRDLAGGIVFTRAATPLPNWQLTRPLAFLGTMLGREDLTPGSASGGEAPGELVRLLTSLRFVRQLMVDDAVASAYERPDRSLGGVRSALWDPSMPPEATALGLLSVVETLGSLDELASRRPTVEAGEGGARSGS